MKLLFDDRRLLIRIKNSNNDITELFLNKIKYKVNHNGTLFIHTSPLALQNLYIIDNNLESKRPKMTLI